MKISIRAVDILSPQSIELLLDNCVDHSVIYHDFIQYCINKQLLVECPGGWYPGFDTVEIIKWTENEEANSIIKRIFFDFGIVIAQPTMDYSDPENSMYEEMKDVVKKLVSKLKGIPRGNYLKYDNYSKQFFQKLDESDIQTAYDIYTYMLPDRKDKYWTPTNIHRIEVAKGAISKYLLSEFREEQSRFKVKIYEDIFITVYLPFFIYGFSSCDLEIKYHQPYPGYIRISSKNDVATAESASRISLQNSRDKGIYCQFGVFLNNQLLVEEIEFRFNMCSYTGQPEFVGHNVPFNFRVIQIKNCFVTTHYEKHAPISSIKEYLKVNDFGFPSYDGSLLFSWIPYKRHRVVELLNEMQLLSPQEYADLSAYFAGDKILIGRRLYDLLIDWKHDLIESEDTSDTEFEEDICEEEFIDISEDDFSNDVAAEDDYCYEDFSDEIAGDDFSDYVEEW